MDIREHESLQSKTTMRIGGSARYYAELLTKEDVEEAYAFAQEKNIPLILLGSGANTIFAEGTINAFVTRIAADKTEVEGNTVRTKAGKNLAMLVNELAAQGLDLSSLTGIPGTIGGAVFGNAGQGPKGIWIDHFINAVEVFIDGNWKMFSKEECHFHYRESVFKKLTSPIIWEVVMTVPSAPPDEIKTEIENLLKKRLETQPHVKTAGSCFKALPDGTPAWQVIDKAGLRGFKIGGVEISEKHANFLLNTEKGNFDDVRKLTETIRSSAPEIKEIEMRLYGNNGKLLS